MVTFEEDTFGCGGKKRITGGSEVNGADFAGYPGDQTGPQKNLINYWVRGAGAAKIGWGSDGSFSRCVKVLGAKLPAQYDVKGMCANLHKAATKEWPAEKGVQS